MSIKNIYDSIFSKHPIISTDTRKIKPNSIFFALKGPNFNANTFAKQALEQGCAYAVVDEKQYALNDRYILVDNVLTTLQDLARHHRTQLQIPVIAIAGSNGKTTTKELISAVLKKKYNTYSTPGNLNNHIGVALCILELTNEHQMAVIELGANHMGENAFLCTIAHPTYGIVTNNGKDHLEGFGSMEGVVKSNNELYEYLKANNGFAFVNADDDTLLTLSKELKRLTYGSSKGADVLGFVKENKSFVKITYSHSQSKNNEVATNLIGKYNLPNLLAAIGIGHYFKVDDSQIKAAMETYTPSNNRSQIIKTEKNILFMDAYNANPSSMAAAIENIAEVEAQKKVLILGDMLEMGNYSKKEHDDMVQFIQSKKFENVILVGAEFAKAPAPATFKKFESTSKALEWLKTNPISNSTILLKGSRGIKLELLQEAL